MIDSRCRATVLDMRDRTIEVIAAIAFTLGGCHMGPLEPETGEDGEAMTTSEGTTDGLGMTSGEPGSSGSSDGSTTGVGSSESTGHESTGSEGSSGSTGEECGIDPAWPADECYVDAAGFCWCGAECMVALDGMTCVCDGEIVDPSYCSDGDSTT